MAGAKAAARAILRHGIGGSIGVDLPTVQGKDQRVAIGAAVDAILPNPFERTAVNGFGFLQIIRPRRHASLFELAADRAAFEARALLRQAARETGPICLAAHPAVIAVIEGHGDWMAALARQVGGTVGLRSDPKLTISGGHAEKP
jgi:ribonuclease G